MNTFIAWSGDLSRKFALLLNDWLPDVIQSIIPFMSSEDIKKGKFWGGELLKKFSECRLGLICITKDNRNAPWLNFEAGALMKSDPKIKICPILIDLEEYELKGPLALFQVTLLQKEEFFKLFISINQELNSPLDEERLKRIFKKNWTTFESKYKKIQESLPTKEKEEKISEEKKIGEISENIKEILHLARSQQHLSSELEDIKDMIESQPTPSHIAYSLKEPNTFFSEWDANLPKSGTLLRQKILQTSTKDSKPNILEYLETEEEEEEEEEEE